jgi:hypothetical protein
MKAVILCGGQGTRIRDVADDIPKPMIRIGERPILWHIMRTYAAAQITDFVLCLGYKSWSIKEYFLNFHAQVADITVCPGRPGEVDFRGDFPERDWRSNWSRPGLPRRPAHGCGVCATACPPMNCSASLMAMASRTSTSSTSSPFTAAMAASAPSPGCARPVALA